MAAISSSRAWGGIVSQHGLDMAYHPFVHPVRTTDDLFDNFSAPIDDVAFWKLHGPVLAIDVLGGIAGRGDSVPVRSQEVAVKLFVFIYTDREHYQTSRTE